MMQKNEDGDNTLTVDKKTVESAPLPPEKQALKKKLIQRDKSIRTTQSEDMQDEVIEDTFPASDPPSHY